MEGVHIEAKEAEVIEVYTCTLCNITFCDNDGLSGHEDSIAHLLQKEKSTATKIHWGLRNSKGFALLESMGWKDDQGLGRDGGIINKPVPTILKRDRKGLGKVPAKKNARVTHFKPKEGTDVVTMDKYERRRIRKRLEEGARGEEEREQERFNRMSWRSGEIELLSEGSAIACSPSAHSLLYRRVASDNSLCQSVSIKTGNKG